MTYYDSNLYEDSLHLLEVLSELVGYDEKKPKDLYIKQDVNDKVAMDNIEQAFALYTEKINNCGNFVVTESKKVRFLGQDIAHHTQQYLIYYDKLLELIESIKNANLENGGLSNIAEYSAGISSIYELCKVYCINVYTICSELVKVYNKLPEEIKRSQNH